MSTQTKSVTTRWKFSAAGISRPVQSEQGKEAVCCDEESYLIDERKPVQIPVAFDSSFSVAAHLATWTCWAFYFVLRFPGAYQPASAWAWTIYLCEAAFVLQDLQSAIELTLSLFGPRKVLERPQYLLKGKRAPKVHVLVTVCGEDMDSIMITVAAAAAQQYPADRFQVFVLDDAADGSLREAVDAFNSTGTNRRGFQDVVYAARQKTPGQRHYYKSGNLRAGLELTESDYGSSEYFAALDADMISEADWLSRTVPHLVKEKDIALASPPQIFYNILDDDALSQDSNAYSQILEPNRDFFGCSQCSGSGYVMRRRALADIGGWPLANIGEDILCSYMLQEKGWKTRYIPDQVQFGLAPGSFHAYISQRIRWTHGSLLVAKHFRLFLPFVGRGEKLSNVQRALSMMGALKAYISPLTFAAIICLPMCLVALQIGEVDGMMGRKSLRLIYLCLFVASNVSKKLVYGRLGGRNVSGMTANRFWTSPFNAYCTLKSLVSDPGNTSFKVSGTFVSPADERSATHRKPLLQRMLSLTMVLYTTYLLIAAAILASLVLFVAHQHVIAGDARTYMYTGAALRLLDIVLAASVPVRYMIFPPSVPEHRKMLEKDKAGVLRSRKKGWTKREGGSRIKLPLQVAIMLLFDWM